MCIDLHDTPLIDKQNDLEIVPIKTKEELLDWSDLVCKLFLLTRQVGRSIYIVVSKYWLYRFFHPSGG